MSYFLFIAVTAFAWGIGNVFVKKGFRNLTPWQTYALDSFFIALPLWMIYGVLAAGDLTTVTPFAILSALIICASYALFYYTINHGQIGVTTTVISTYPIITFILAYLLLKERLTLLPLMGVILSMIGAVIVSLPAKLKLKPEKWFVLSVLVAISYGITGYLEKTVLTTINNATFLMTLALTQVVIVLLWWPFTRDKFPKLNFRRSGHSFIGILLFNIGNIVYLMALEKGLASLVVPLSNTYVTITVLFSLFWLKEKISRLQIAGIVCVVIGVILVGFNGSTADTSEVTVTSREKAIVSFVYDGDTVELSDKRKVRYLGIDTPEMNFDHGTADCFATEAAHINRQLVEKQVIEMEKDKEDADKYGRLLRYVYVDNVLINEFLLRQGYARKLIIPPNIKYTPLLEQAEKEAREEKRGLWGACGD